MDFMRSPERSESDKMSDALVHTLLVPREVSRAAIEQGGAAYHKAIDLIFAELDQIEDKRVRSAALMFVLWNLRSVEERTKGDVTRLLTIAMTETDPTYPVRLMARRAEIMERMGLSDD